MGFENLKKTLTAFNETSAQQKLIAFEALSRKKLSSPTLIKKYHDALLFTLAYPENEAIRDIAATEMERLGTQIKKLSSDQKEKLVISGITNCRTDGAFSWSLAKWLLKEYKTDVLMHSLDENGAHPKEVFKYAFPDMEFEMLSDEKLNSEKWIEQVSGTKDKHEKLAWIVNQLDAINAPDALKEQLFESLKVYITIKGDNRKFSRSFGNLFPEKTYYHSNGILKKFDEAALINKKLPEAKKISREEKNKIINVSRTALALLNRETDPVTYCNEEGVRYYELEHGLSIALFSMLPNRRLPLESYIGFMMYKNGYPMAYGGGWLFGHRSLLGINIFEAFRGGESAFVFAQLLRTYKNAFGAEYFEVEPYQFGKNNPEGLKSGAFWFYYRFGFRPLSQQLNQLASIEASKIASVKGYRSSIETLKEFTAGNVFVNFSKHAAPVNPSLISKFITKVIAERYKGDRSKAVSESKKQIVKELKLSASFVRKNQVGLNKLNMFLSLCIDLNYLNIQQKAQLIKLIEQKSNSEMDYIKTLSKFNLRKLLNKNCVKAISY